MTLAVTDGATEVLKDLLDSAETQPEQVLRLVTDSDGSMSLALDTEKDGDQVVERQGETVMVIEPVISDNLDGATLDVRDTPQGPALTLTQS